MAELADALHSGCSVRKDVQVRLLFRALVVVITTASVTFAQQRLPVALLPTSTARERADYYLREGNDDSARVYYQLWTSANPRDTTALLTLARLYAKVGDYRRSFDVLTKAAYAGAANIEGIQRDTILSRVIEGRDGIQLLERISNNALEQKLYELRFALQERIGRYRVLYPPNFDSRQRYHLVLLLHGNGNEPMMMLRWAKALDLQRAIVVCPEAAYVKISETIAQGRLRLSAAGEDLGAPDTMNAQIVNLSAQWYRSVLEDAERSLPLITGSLPIVVGFSQGGFYAQVLISRYPERFRAAVLLSSSYYAYGGIRERLDSIRRYGLEILHVHGRKDSIVPIQTAWLMQQLYRQAEVRYTLWEFDGGHWISDDLARSIGRWIEERLR